MNSPAEERESVCVDIEYLADSLARVSAENAELRAVLSDAVDRMQGSAPAIVALRNRSMEILKRTARPT
jgi:hypothetical protein